MYSNKLQTVLNLKDFNFINPKRIKILRFGVQEYQIDHWNV